MGEAPRPSVGWGWAPLGILGGCALATPYVGDALGLELDVAASVEIIDHVVPGLVVVSAAGLALALRRDAEREHELPVLVAAACALLAGLWITTSHLPLLIDAAQGSAPLGASLWHAAAGPPVLALAVWLFASEYRAAAKA